ncbi:multiple cyclophane-containing RiPP AmcA [Streptomyces sp. NPDC059525]|uniref:multiple cyclophane-containing RiPP AmcA n=1 Tax=Streptomyces sp. NPDC059525 TaxID=3346857 RepID=UPI0036CFB8AB
MVCTSAITAPDATALVMDSAEEFESLLEAAGTRPLAAFNNQPTWDNPTPAFDNRPTWDNWSKH